MLTSLRAHQLVSKRSAYRFFTGTHVFKLVFFNRGQRSLLPVIGHSLRHPSQAITGKDFVARTDIPTSSIPDIRKVLTKADLIEKSEEGVWQVVDPFFAAWFCLL